MLRGRQIWGGGESTIDKINEKRPYCTPAPQRQGHLLMRGPSKKPLSLILSNSDDRMQSQRQRDDKHEGGVGEGPPALQPHVDARAIASTRIYPLPLLLSNSDDRTQPWQKGDDERGWGGKGSPAPQPHADARAINASTRCY